MLNGYWCRHGCGKSVYYSRNVRLPSGVQVAFFACSRCENEGVLDEVEL